MIICIVKIIFIILEILEKKKLNLSLIEKIFLKDRDIILEVTIKNKNVKKSFYKNLFIYVRKM